MSPPPVVRPIILNIFEARLHLHFDFSDFRPLESILKGGKVLLDGVLDIGERLFLGVPLRPTAG
jgi:hypothetical protein